MSSTTVTIVNINQWHTTSSINVISLATRSIASLRFTASPVAEIGDEMEGVVSKPFTLQHPHRLSKTNEKYVITLLNSLSRLAGKS